MEEKSNLNKSLYKLLIILLKYTPIALAVIDVSYTITSYYDILNYLLNCIGGTSVVFLITLYIISYVFLFCYLFRIPLYYITITLLISFIDVYVGIPLSDLNMLRLYFGIAGISLISYIYLKYKKKC